MPPQRPDQPSGRADGYPQDHGEADPLDCSARGVAQLGSALALGARGHRFKSGHPDQVDGVIADLGGWADRRYVAAL